MTFTESIVEDAALSRLEGLGYAIKHGLEIRVKGTDLIIWQVFNKEGFFRGI